MKKIQLTNRMQTRLLRTAFLSLCLGFIFTGKVFCQKEVQHIGQAWAGYFNQLRFNDKWGLWSDFHLRTKEEVFKDFSTGIARFGLTYYVNDNLRLTAGYAFINHFPADAHKNISQPEHRPWQQVQWISRFSKLRLTQAIRLEQRFRRKILNDDELADGYNFNNRVRINMLLQLPLSKNAFQPGTLSLVLNDELHINFGEEIVYNTFDQNRFFAGFHYHLNSHDNLQFGYMNMFVQQAAGNKYRSLHVARVFFLHQMDLRKKE